MMSGSEQMAGFSRMNYITFLTLTWGFPDSSVVKNPPAMQETWVPSLGWEDSLKKKGQPTPVFLLRKSHGQRSLAGHGVAQGWTRLSD